MQKPGSDTVPMNEEGSPVGAHDSELDSVKQELAKWQKRVPKLAAALKERTNEVERLKAGNSDAVEADAYSDAGVKARDELIIELEAKVTDLTAKHRDLQGELHARDLTGKDLEVEVASWKDKWHSVTQSLDTQSELATANKQELTQIREASEQALAEAAAASERSLAELQTELDELTARNDKLNETIELANRQIESLGDNLNNLREQLRAKDARIGELSGSEQDVTREMQALNSRANDFEARALQAEQQVETDKNKIGDLETEVEQKTDACTRLEQDNERLNRDQDDLLAQMQALKEAHESALTQQADALSSEQQETQEKELQALEQRLIEEHAGAIEKASARHSELEAELVAKDNESIERLA